MIDKLDLKDFENYTRGGRKFTVYFGHKRKQQRLVNPTREELNQALTEDVERQLARLAEFKKALAQHFPRTDDQASK